MTVRPTRRNISVTPCSCLTSVTAVDHPTPPVHERDGTLSGSEATCALAVAGTGGLATGSAGHQRNCVLHRPKTGQAVELATPPMLEALSFGQGTQSVRRPPGAVSLWPSERSDWVAWLSSR